MEAVGRSLSAATSKIRSSSEEYRVELKKDVYDRYNIFESITNALKDTFRMALSILKPILLFQDSLFRRKASYKKAKLTVPRLKELLKDQELETARDYFKKQFDSVCSLIH